VVGRDDGPHESAPLSRAPSIRQSSRSLSQTMTVVLSAKRAEGRAADRVAAGKKNERRFRPLANPRVSPPAAHAVESVTADQPARAEPTPL